MMWIRNVVGVLWLLFVAGWYFKYHDYYVSSLEYWKPFFGVAFTLAVIVLITWKYLKHHGKNGIKLTLFRGFAAFFIVAWLSAMSLYIAIDPAVFTAPYQVVPITDEEFAVYRENVAIPEGTPPSFSRGSILGDWSTAKTIFSPEMAEFFTAKPVWTFGRDLAWNLIKTAGLFVLFFIYFYGVGRVISRLFQKNEESYPRSPFEVFETIAWGMAVSMGAMFLLGVPGFLTPSIVRIVFGGLLLAGLSQWKSLVAMAHAAHVNIPFKFWPWFMPLSGALMILLGLNVVESMIPFPIGFDAMHMYHNTPNLLVQYGQLVKGLPAYNFELLLSLGHFIFGTPRVAILLTVWAGILCFGLLFDTLRQRLPVRDAFGATVFFASLPMVIFLLHIDHKIDLALFFFSLLAIRHAVAWAQEQSNESPKSHLIKLGILMGLMFGIKYTSALLITMIFAFFGYTFWGAGMVAAFAFLLMGILARLDFLIWMNSFETSMQKAIGLILIVIGIVCGAMVLVKKKVPNGWWHPFVISGGLMALVFGPWMILNGMETSSLSPQALLNGERQELIFDASDFGINQCPAKVSNYNELELYTGFYGGPSLWLPGILLWESNVNSGLPNNRITDISLFFLGLIIFLIFPGRAAREQEPHWNVILAFTLIYWFLWAVSSNGVIWYGMAMFAGLLLLYGRVLSTQRWMHWAIGLWMIGSILMRFYSTAVDSPSLLYAGRLTDTAMLLEQRVNASVEISARVNDEQFMNKNVMLVGSFMKYFIQGNDHRVYNDKFLEGYNCIFKNPDPQIILQRLREKNIAFIIYSRDVLRVEPAGYGPLHDLFAEFEEFAGQHLVPEVIRPNVMLYSVPPVSAISDVLSQ